MAHASRQPSWKWLAGFIRAIILISLGIELISVFTSMIGFNTGKNTLAIMTVLSVLTAGMLFLPFRQGISVVLSCLNQLFSGQIFLAKRQLPSAAAGAIPVTGDAIPVIDTAITANTITTADVAPEAQAMTADNTETTATTPEQLELAAKESITVVKPNSIWLARRIFVAESMPHLTALWIYVTCLAYILSSIDMSNFNLPALPIPIPVPIDQLFSYNGLGLIMLSVFGVGIFITRKPKEVLQRLGIVKPTLMQIGIGIAMIFVTFAYDWIWSLFTHQFGSNMASRLSNYNAGTFTGGGDALSSFLLALATGIFAGVGEETLIRGALQPVLGIFPAGLLHGALHGQFTHAPIYIVQVAGWSTMMGIVRYYTNTTTTIISHVGFNFITTFLFAFNP
jgi:membrane protease YdiL (CAAX protease family)